MSLWGEAEERAMGVFSDAMKHLKNGGHIKPGMALNDIIGHKKLAEHIDSGTLDMLKGMAGSGDHDMIKYMMGKRGILSAGGTKGQQGLARAHGAINRILGGNKKMNAMMNGLERQMGELEPGSERYKTLEAMHNNLRGEHNRIGRYARAGWDAASGGLSYMNSGSMLQRGAKWGVAGAAYVGAAGAVRSATGGGSMFYDGDGRRDIAGIPFL